MSTNTSRSYSFIYYLNVAIMGIIVSIGIQVAFAWTAPNAAPPDDNTDPPITIGEFQSKEGGLGLNSANLDPNGLFVANGNAIVANGNVGIGTTDPRGRLEINAGFPSLVISDHIAGKSDYNDMAILGREGANIEFFGANGLDGSSPANPHSKEIYIDSDGPVYFRKDTDSSFKMEVAANGNVGIGVFNPPEKLAVAGAVRAEKYCNQDGTKCLEFGGSTHSAFRVSLAANYNSGENVPLKVHWDTVDFDLGSEYDTVNHWFRPADEGYYFLNALVCYDDLDFSNANGPDQAFVTIHKNDVGLGVIGGPPPGITSELFGDANVTHSGLSDPCQNVSGVVYSDGNDTFSVGAFQDDVSVTPVKLRSHFSGYKI